MQSKISVAEALPSAVTTRETPERPESAQRKDHGSMAPMVSTLNLLLVEDNPGDVRLVQELLRFVHNPVCHLSLADCLAAALVRISNSRPDLILLDLSLPDSQGLETFLRVRSQATGIPIIVLSGLDDERLAAEAVGQGAQDYLVKGNLDSALVIRAIRYSVERHRAEEQRRQSEGFASASLNALSANIAILDETGRILAVNKAWNDFGRANSANWAVIEAKCGVGANYLEVCDKSACSGGEGAEDCVDGIRAVISGALEEYSLEYPCHSPVAQRWFLCRITRFHVNDRVRVVILHANITERKKGEQDIIAAHAEALRARDEVETINKQLQQAVQKANELRASVERENLTKSVMLAAIASILICVDADDLILQWNPAAELAFGIPAAAVLNKPFYDARIQWDWTIMQERVAACLHASKPVRLNDFHFMRPEGKEGILGITLTPLPLLGRQQAGFLLVGADITERKFMESQLAHAQKMESIGQLAAGIAHEINTPTQYIGDNTRFVKEAFEELSGLLTETMELVAACKAGTVPTELVARIEATMEQADMDYLQEEIPIAIQQSLDGIGRVAKIVQAMKEFSHPGTGQKVALDINRAIESALTVARNEWKYVAEVVTEFDPCLPLVPCLPGDFSQVILNLVINAAHAIAGVGKGDEAGKGIITIRTLLTDAWAEIRISDTGMGIPEAIRKRVFDPFFTTKEVGKGTGQGLAIAHSIMVDKHQGTIHFETEMGLGTTFILRLPLEETRQRDRIRAA